MNKIKLFSIIITFLIVGTLTYFAPSSKSSPSKPLIGNFKKVTFIKQESNELELKTNINFVSGELNIFPIETRNLYEFDALYKIREVKPIIDFKPGKKATLDINLKRYHKLGLSARSYWKIGLSSDTNHDLHIETRASRQNLDFTDIPIKKLFLKTGTSKINIYFNELNKLEMESIDIDSGASDCRIYGLTNARAKKINIHVGTGFYTIDFSGQQKTACQVNIDGVITKAKLIIPTNINTKITFRDTLLTSIDLPSNFIKRSKTEYVSQNFNPHGIILDIIISLGTGYLSIIN
jgi:hypothetical protein